MSFIIRRVNTYKITLQTIPHGSSVPSTLFQHQHVTNVSRIIKTKSGKYQIVAIMDIDSEKTSINLYDSNIGKLKFGEIYNITKVKKTMLRKDQATELRLLTTKFTKISEANEEDKGKFENVKLADKQIQGIIVGFGDINSYKSCEKHWNKLDEEDLCPKCESPPTKVKIDFNTDLYIQDSSTGDIKLFKFSRGK